MLRKGRKGLIFWVGGAMLRGVMNWGQGLRHWVCVPCYVGNLGVQQCPPNAVHLESAPYIRCREEPKNKVKII